MHQLLKHFCSVFEGTVLFRDVYVPSYQVVPEQVPGKLGVSSSGKAALGNALFRRCGGDRVGRGYVLL